jgi:hypothetical protein
MELKGDRDLDLVDRIYADHPLLGEVVERLGGEYVREFDMTNAARLFVSRSKLHALSLLRQEEDLRDPRTRARLRVAGYVPLYEGKSFWLHNPYFQGRNSRESIGKCVALADVEKALPTGAWRHMRLCMRNVASSTNQRTFIVGLLPPSVHGNSAPTLDGLDTEDAFALKPVLASLVVDYIVRMKVSANLNWFYLETIPIPEWDLEQRSTAAGLATRLNAIGEDFPDQAGDPLLDGGDRMAARLVLDALVAELYRLDAADVHHIASTFPIYDRDTPAELRYPRLAAQVYEAMVSGGVKEARARAAALIDERRDVGCGFGLDELWVPEGGWERANEQARYILSASARFA